MLAVGQPGHRFDPAAVCLRCRVAAQERVVWRLQRAANWAASRAPGIGNGGSSNTPDSSKCRIHGPNWSPTQRSPSGRVAATLGRCHRRSGAAPVSPRSRSGIRSPLGSRNEMKSRTLTLPAATGRLELGADVIGADKEISRVGLRAEPVVGHREVFAGMPPGRRSPRSPRPAVTASGT